MRKGKERLCGVRRPGRQSAGRAVALGALFSASVAGHAAIAADTGTCTPSGQTVALVAPPPALVLRPTSEVAAIQDKLDQREVLNPAGPWLDQTKHRPGDYGIVWHSWDELDESRPIWLRELYWSYYYPDRRKGHYRAYGPDLQHFVTQERWHTDAEYGVSYRTAIEDPAFPEYFAGVVQEALELVGADGIMLDWWIDDQPGRAANDVRADRIRIATAIRSRIGPNPILLANVGWTQDAATHNNLNGVFMELWKRPPDAGYNCDQLLKIEDLLDFHDRYLAEPKIVVLEPWRLARADSDADRRSDTNQRWARLFGAMSVVVPRNGYFIYSDNAADTSDSDHGHVFYDFFDIDLGAPTSAGTPVTPGVGYKTFEHGFVAYNASRDDVILRIAGLDLRLPAMSGAFCRDNQATEDCRFE